MVAGDFPYTDLVHAQHVAKLYGLDLTVISASVDDLLAAIDGAIRILGVFNPIEIRNNIVVFMAMERAKKDGLKHIMTGDGADELFAGYNFFRRMSPMDLEKDLERIWRVMHFPSKKISESIGTVLCSPFLDDAIISFAKSVPAELKVREENGQTWGKWILRKAFENSLPPTVVWREKAAMQDGSGTGGLTRFFDELVPDMVFFEKAKNYLQNEQVALQSKEALHYYEVYRKYGDYPALLGESETRCPFCKYSVEKGANFCRMCGSYPL